MKDKYHKVVNDCLGNNVDTDIFIIHFKKEFTTLLKKISDVADKQELFIDADYFLNADNVLKVLQPDNKNWRYTWQIDYPVPKLFEDVNWSQYFDKTSKMVKDNKIDQIQVILIISDKNILVDPKFEKLLHFYKTFNRMDCKIINNNNFRKIISQNSIGNYRDFGIYSDRLLFIEIPEEQVSGHFIKDREIISNYTNLFNQLWTSVFAEENPSRQSNPIDFKVLFDFDNDSK